MVPLVLRDTVRTETTGLEILSALPGMAEAKVLSVVNDIDLSYLSRRRNGPRDASVLLIYFGGFSMKYCTGMAPGMHLVVWLLHCLYTFNRQIFVFFIYDA